MEQNNTPSVYRPIAGIPADSIIYYAGEPYTIAELIELSKHVNVNTWDSTRNYQVFKQIIRIEEYTSYDWVEMYFTNGHSEMRMRLATDQRVGEPATLGLLSADGLTIDREMLYGIAESQLHDKPHPTLACRGWDYTEKSSRYDGVKRTYHLENVQAIRKNLPDRCYTITMSGSNNVLVTGSKDYHENHFGIYLGAK